MIKYPFKIQQRQTHKFIINGNLQETYIYLTQQQLKVKLRFFQHVQKTQIDFFFRYFDATGKEYKLQQLKTILCLK